VLLALLTNSNVKPVWIVLYAGSPALSLYPANSCFVESVAILYAPNTFAPLEWELAVVATGLTPL